MTNEQRIIEENNNNKELVFLQGFDGAIIGTAWSKGVKVVCYSIPKMVHQLTIHENMTKQEANEWLDHNTLFAYFGDHTPVFLEEHL